MYKVDVEREGIKQRGSIGKG